MFNILALGVEVSKELLIRTACITGGAVAGVGCLYGAQAWKRRAKNKPAVEAPKAA